METLECIFTRQSVRTYDTKHVPEQLIEKIIEAGVAAPSAGNIQPWEFVVVQDKKTKNKLCDASLKQEHVKKAPVVIVVCANTEKAKDKYKERGEKFYSIQATAACIQNILLAAHDLGLATCWVGAFEDNEISEILELPTKLRPVAIITLGFPYGEKKPLKTKRLPYRNVTWTEKYGKDWKFEFKPLDLELKEKGQKIKEKYKDKPKEFREMLEKLEGKEEQESFPEKFRKFIKKLTK